MYYDIHNVLSYNALLNFVVGERGVGKTYSTKKFCINDFLKNHKQFVYLRRYKTELNEACEDFFGGLKSNNEFEDHELKVKKSKNGATFLCDGEVMGYGVTLSTAVILKSREFPDVKNIIFDEFVIDKGAYHYLPNEVHYFLDILETIGRLKDIRVFLLGNAISRVNPYFNYFNINEPYNSEIKTFKNGLILINCIKNLEYREKKRSTRFGQLIEGTEYGSYAIDNKWLHENNVFIEKRPPKAKFFFTIKVGNSSVGIWNDMETAKVYVSLDYDPSSINVFALSSNDHDENTKLTSRTSEMIKVLVNHFKNGMMFFENQRVKAIFLPYIYKFVNL